MLFNDFKLLTEEQVFGGFLKNRRLDVLKKYGLKSYRTDFSCILGAISEFFRREAPYYLSSDINDVNIKVVSTLGDKIYVVEDNTKMGIRPICSINTQEELTEIYKKSKMFDNNVFEFEYGWYPQSATDDGMNIFLESLYFDNELPKTGRNYTPCLDGVSYDEYEYNGRYYIRFVTNQNAEGNTMISDGHKIESNKYYWIEVLPIKWLVDIKSRLLISKYILSSGISVRKKAENIFNKNDLEKFFENFARDISQPLQYKNEIDMYLTKRVK